MKYNIFFRRTLILFGAMLFVFVSAYVAMAQDLPQISVIAPKEAKIGDVVTANIIVHLPSGQKVSAVSAALVWSNGMLDPVGEPNINNKIFTTIPTKNDNLFNVNLIAKNNRNKGLTEIVLARMLKGDQNIRPGNDFVIASIHFRIKGNIIGNARIGFTTDTNIAPSGTMCYFDETPISFADLKAAIITIR